MRRPPEFTGSTETVPNVDYATTETALIQPPNLVTTKVAASSAPVNRETSRDRRL
jgi:hypothetical protein